MKTRLKRLEQRRADRTLEAGPDPRELLLERLSRYLPRDGATEDPATPSRELDEAEIEDLVKVLQEGAARAMARYL